ncbi:MAG: four helix bundle protein [Terriglobia bacterium]
MDEKTFKERTRRFALEVIRLVNGLPKARTPDVIGRQLLRSGTSVGANYRSACRGLSTADALSKLATVEEEADELELLTDAGVVSTDQLDDLKKEADEIVAMTVASIKTLRARL